MSKTAAEYRVPGLRIRRGETDPGPRGLVRRLGQPTDGPDNRTKIAIVSGNAMLQLCKPGRDLRMRHRQPAESHEHPHDEHAHLDGPRAVQDRGGHDRPVFRERPRKNRRKPESLEVVTGCDHLGSFGLRELESKVRWEAFDVSSDRLIESFGRDAVGRTSIPQRAVNTS